MKCGQHFLLLEVVQIPYIGRQMDSIYVLSLKMIRIYT